MAPKRGKKLSAKEQRDAQKAAKQKKILLILAPVMLIAVAIQVPRLLGGGEEEAASTETTLTDTAGATSTAPDEAGNAPEPSGEPQPAGTPPADAGSSPVVVEPAALGTSSSTRLSEVPDSDPLPPVDVTELISFSTFVGDDPFVQQVEPEQESEPESEPAAEPDSGEPGSEGGEPGVITALAILEINGEQEVVAVAASFPADDPAFELIAIKGSESIEFGLAEGSFSSGIDSLDLEAGKSITLISQPDGFRYTFRLVSIAGDAGAIETAPAPPAEPGA